MAGAKVSKDSHETSLTAQERFPLAFRPAHVKARHHALCVD